MKRYSGFILLGLAVLMALVTSSLFYNWMEQQTRGRPSRPQQIALPVVRIAVAAEDLFWGTALTDEMIKLVSFPKESLVQGYLSTVEQAKGRVLIANIKANEPILEAKLAPADAAQGGMAMVTQRGKRAMAVRVDDVVGVAGFINPGNRVDVLVTLRRSSPKSKTVLQNVLVLATGLQMDGQDPKAKPKQVRVITVEVTPEEAEKLALAAAEGTVTMALRSYANTQPVLTQGATLRTLLNSYRPDSQQARRRPLSAARRTPSTQVELIKGETLELLTFKAE
jgi:pilus assembly protein CpaB